MDGDAEDTIVRLAQPATLVIDVLDGDTVVRDRVQQREPAKVDKPVAAIRFHSFVVNGREELPLDRPAIIGRKPTAARIRHGASPRLVTVPSALGEVSSVHVELSQHGAMVVVTDLRSTNGITVRMPGAVPLKLRQGESVVVLPGSLVDIGDGNVIEILPPQRLVPAGDIQTERYL
ncbi:MAG: hypothetical protein JWP30_80 [Homoserinimonas sp.]|nr:hypothetical protein [Homoserinimonas sp.]